MVTYPAAQDDNSVVVFGGAHLDPMLPNWQTLAKQIFYFKAVTLLLFQYEPMLASFEAITASEAVKASRGHGILTTIDYHFFFC